MENEEISPAGGAPFTGRDYSSSRASSPPPSALANFSPSPVVRRKISESNRITIAMVAVLTVLMVALVLSMVLANQRSFGARATLETGLEHLVRGDANGAATVFFTKISAEKRGLLKSKLYGTKGSHVRNYEITGEVAKDNGTEFTAHITTDGGAYEAKFLVTPGPAKYMIMSTWYVTPPEDWSIAVSYCETCLERQTIRDAKVSVDGESYNLKDFPLPAFPGQYGVSVDGVSVYEHILNTGTVHVGGDDRRNKILVGYEYSRPFNEQVNLLVQARVERCFAAKSPPQTVECAQAQTYLMPADRQAGSEINGLKLEGYTLEVASPRPLVPDSRGKISYYVTARPVASYSYTRSPAAGGGVQQVRREFVYKIAYEASLSDGVVEVTALDLDTPLPDLTGTPNLQTETIRK